MVSGEQHTLADSPGPPASTNMPPPSHHFRLRAMCQNSTRSGSPGEMNLHYDIAVDDEKHEVDFAVRDEAATFEAPRNNDNTELNGIKARFCCQGNQLMLEPHTPRVYVESPPSNDLPRQSDFNRIAIEMSNSEKQRVIYLRPGDTVVLEVEHYYIKVLAVATKFLGAIGAPQGDQSTSANEIQVRSSIQQLAADAETASGAPEDDGDKDDDDDDDLDATPSGDEDVTPATATSRQPGPTVKETPSKPSRDNDHVLSTAPDVNDAHYAIESANDLDSSTPPAKRNMQPQDDAGSQIFPQGLKGQTTYRRTPKQRFQAAMDRAEVLESSDPDDMSPESPGENSAALEPRRGGTRSSLPKRRHSMTDEDEGGDDVAAPASTASPLKRPRGRPPKASKTTKATPTKTPATGKPRGRPSNASRAAQQAEDDDKHIPSPSKLSPDLNPRSSSTPQPPSTPMTGKAPTKILLSNSKFAENKKTKAFLSQHGATIGGVIPGKRTNFVCVVGNGELATTAKVLRSLALGKRVVTDDWIEHSMREGLLLELDDYIHDDLSLTADFNRSKLFENKTLFITDAQTKAYGDGIDNIKELASAVGAWKVESGSAKKASSMPAASTIILGGDANDHDASKLTNEGRTVYQKAMLTQSVIRGELLVDEEKLKWGKTGKKGKK